jgi:SLOG-like protein/ATPase family protein associated with various cellular activities (AAA)
MTFPVSPELSRGIEIVSSDYRAKQPPAIEGVDRFGELSLFANDERDQLFAVRDLIKQYIARPEPARPLSLAVFGAPGSGKSFTVKQILSDLKLSPTNVNLTQLADSRGLGEVLARASKSAEVDPPVIFFDEFDAPRDGAPYGWLAWFLAPMQDGEFVHEGQVVQLRRALFFFAGGTASTMQQFSDFSELSEFQRAKGPDFVSRLRGFLDVNGPNEQPRILRRAILFRAELSRAVGNGARTFRPDRELMESLLQVGRYRHGARSISAVVDLSQVDKKQRFAWDNLPKDHLLEMHIDRGPLDTKLIGGAIALSGYSVDLNFEQWWCNLARRLWNEGATLAYAGRWAVGPGGWLMKFLENELRKRPPEPSADPHRRAEPDPWLINFLDVGDEASVDAAISLDDRNRMGLKVTFAPHLTERERKRLDGWSLSVLEHFRRRLAITDSSVARFAIVGATAMFNGRFPGVAEEVMLSLAQGKPVYISGALGGAAQDIGSLLGLAHPRRSEVPSSFRSAPKGKERTLRKIAHELRPSPWTQLPVTAAEAASFLKEHAMGGPKWPENGLTFDENRRLFTSSDSNEVANLVVTGLLRRFANLML